MITTTAKVSLSFGKARDHEVAELAGTILDDLYGNPRFPSPPVSHATLKGALTAHTRALTEQTAGGPRATAIKRLRRQELVELLRELALHVEGASGGDLPTLLGSGFQARRHNTSQSPLPQPGPLIIKHADTGTTKVSLKRIRNAKCYEVQVALMDDAGGRGPWVTAGLHAGSRNISVTGLIPGKMYAYRLRAVGGSEGFSPWGNPVRHRAL